jgi:hypothetical protein
MPKMAGSRAAPAIFFKAFMLFSLRRPFSGRLFFFKPVKGLLVKPGNAGAISLFSFWVRVQTADLVNEGF